METGFRLDQKLDPVNQVGIFLGFATPEGMVRKFLHQTTL